MNSRLSKKVDVSDYIMNSKLMIFSCLKSKTL